MAIAAVGGASNNSAVNVTTLTVTRTVTAGNIVVLFIAFPSAVGSLVVKDNNNVSLNAGSAQPNLFCFYYTAGSGVTSFTATWTTAVNVSMAVEEYSGAAGVDGSFSTFHNSANSATATQAIPLIAANDWAVCGLASANTITGTVGNQRQQTTTGAARLTLMDNTAASISTVSCTGTLTSGVWVACGVILGGPGSARAEQDLAIAVIKPSTAQARVEQDLALALIKPSTGKARVEQDVMIAIVSNTYFPTGARIEQDVLIVLCSNAAGPPVAVRPQLCINT